MHRDLSLLSPYQLFRPPLSFGRKLLPAEGFYNFREFNSPPLDNAYFQAKPMVLLLGEYSVGKTSFIKYLLERSFPAMQIGPEPTTGNATVWTVDRCAFTKSHMSRFRYRPMSHACTNPIVIRMIWLIDYDQWSFIYSWPIIKYKCRWYDSYLMLRTQSVWLNFFL